MTIWAEQSQIALLVVLSITVDVIKLKRKWKSVPCWKTATKRTGVFNTFFNHSSFDTCAIAHLLKRL